MMLLCAFTPSAQRGSTHARPTEVGYLTFVLSASMLSECIHCVGFIDAIAFSRPMEKRMFGYSLIRLGFYIALAIIASTAIGLFTYIVVSTFAE